MTKSLEDRFWEKVNKTATCWLWTAGKASGGRYGSFRTPKQRVARAHRVSYELHYGPIPQGMNVLHKCDVPLCVRPDHLFLGSQDQNVQDCIGKGRRNYAHGSKQGLSVLTARQVAQIKGSLTGEHGEGTRLATEYGVSPTTICSIKKGRSWKWLVVKNGLPYVTSASPEDS